MNLKIKGKLLNSMKLIEAHERVVYSSVQDRKKIQWPKDARVALCIVPNVEHYEYLPPLIPFATHIRARNNPMLEHNPLVQQPLRLRAHLFGLGYCHESKWHQAALIEARG